jgi:hypothetical protein
VKVRLIGLALIAAGLAAGWYFGLGPLQEAQAGAARVRVEMKIFIFAPMAVLFGLVALIGGDSVASSILGPPRTRRDHLIVWPVFGLAMALGGLAWWWMDAQLDALGYLATG